MCKTYYMFMEREREKTLWLMPDGRFHENSNSVSLYLFANQEDSFTWSPSAQDVGSYWYTCAIAGHRDFLGQIEVVAVPEPSSYSLLLGVLAIWIVSYRRCRW